MEEFQKGEPLLKSLPVKAWLAFTGRCNLNCLHCPRGSIGERPPQGLDLTTDLFDKIEEQVLPCLLQCRVGGNNLGEQLLARQWSKFSEKLNAFQISRNLVTNGLLMNQEKARDLVLQGWTVDFSTEGATNESYFKVRKASFEKFLRAVNLFCEMKAKEGSTQSKARFAFTAFHDNIEQLPLLIELAAKMGTDEILVTHLVPMNVSQREQSLVYHKQLANDVFHLSIKLAADAGVKLHLPPMFSAETGEARKPCLHPWTSVSIDEKGDIYPCCVYDEPLGNIRNHDFNEIWNNRAYQNLRRSVNGPKPPVNCRRCALRGADFTSVNCSDEEALLGQVGALSSNTFFLRLKLRQALGSSSLGRSSISLIRKLLKK